MADTPVKVRRARPDDAGSIGNFLSKATRGRVVVPYEDVVERLGSKAYFLATTDEIVALAGWRAENLVGRVDDLVIYPGSVRPTAGRALFEQVEKEARKLECEVLLLYIPVNAAQAAIVFYQSMGYQRRLTGRYSRAVAAGYRRISRRESLCHGQADARIGDKADLGEEQDRMSALKQWINIHPKLAAWLVLAIGMVVLVVWSAKDVGLLPGQMLALVVATIGLAGLCVWIIGWED